MLYTVVGKTGSGKSLLQAFWVYQEIDRILNARKGIKWYQFWKKLSYYDIIAMNSDFNDSRGNFVRYRHSNEECICEVKKEGVHWCQGGVLIGITDLPELYDKKNVLVMLDEAGTMFSNHDWDKMPDGYRHFLTSHRHNVTHLPMRFDIFVFTQHKDIIDITLRRVSQRIFLVRPLFRFSKNPTRDGLVHKIAGIRVWVHWEHELLKMQPIQYNSDGKIKEVHPQDSLESLQFYTWYWFPSLGRYVNKYIKSYNTVGEVLKIKRESKK